jgi:hypothetical protein
MIVCNQKNGMYLYIIIIFSMFYLSVYIIFQCNIFYQYMNNLLDLLYLFINYPVNFQYAKNNK